VQRAPEVATSQRRIGRLRTLQRTFGVSVDFDLEDALDRLVRDGLVKEDADGTLHTLLPAAADPFALEIGRVVAGIAAVAGHVWTFLAGFKGGKGVATTVGVLLALSPAAFGIFVAVFVLTLALTRYVSLGSTLGAIAFVVALWRLQPAGVKSPAFALGVALALLIVWRHRDNYARLARGEERRFALRGGKTS